MRWSPKGGVERGLAALFTEVGARRPLRLHRHRSSSRQKLNLQRGLERAVVEKDKSPSRPLADEFVRNFIQDEPIPGIVYEYGLNQRFLPEITLAEVNARGQGLDARSQPSSSRSRAPESDQASLPNEAKLAGVISGGERRSADGVRRYGRARSRCSARLPTPGAVANDRRRTTRSGITEWQLSNGVRVVLKPTTFKQDEILFRAVSPGGTSLASDEDFIAGGNRRRGDRARRPRRAQPDRSGQGARRHDGVRAGPTSATPRKGCAAAPRAKISRRCSSSIYLTFTAPRADPVAFRVLTEQLKVTLANRQAQPETAVQRGARRRARARTIRARSR